MRVPKLRSLGLSIISASLIFGNQVLASVPDPILDQQTNSYFGYVNPEISSKSIRFHRTQYEKEWLAIRAVLNNRLVWMQLPLCYAEPGEYGYEVDDEQQFSL